MGLEVSTCLTSEYTTKLQSSRQYGTGTKIEIYRSMEKSRMEWEKSIFLTSDYTTKLQSSRQYGTGTKTEI